MKQKKSMRDTYFENQNNYNVLFMINNNNVEVIRLNEVMLWTLKDKKAV